MHAVKYHIYLTLYQKKQEGSECLYFKLINTNIPSHHIPLIEPSL